MQFRSSECKTSRDTRFKVMCSSPSLTASQPLHVIVRRGACPRPEIGLPHTPVVAHQASAERVDSVSEKRLTCYCLPQSGWSLPLPFWVHTGATLRRSV